MPFPRTGIRNIRLENWKDFGKMMVKNHTVNENIEKKRKISKNT